MQEDLAFKPEVGRHLTTPHPAVFAFLAWTQASLALTCKPKRVCQRCPSQTPGTVPAAPQWVSVVLEKRFSSDSGWVFVGRDLARFFCQKPRDSQRSWSIAGHARLLILPGSRQPVLSPIECLLPAINMNLHCRALGLPFHEDAISISWHSWRAVSETAASRSGARLLPVHVVAGVCRPAWMWGKQRKWPLPDCLATLVGMTFHMKYS
jgi:hypothetical protein